MKSLNIWNVWNVVINGTQMMQGEKSILFGHKCCTISVVLGEKKEKLHRPTESVRKLSANST